MVVAGPNGAACNQPRSPAEAGGGGGGGGALVDIAIQVVAWPQLLVSVIGWPACIGAV